MNKKIKIIIGIIFSSIFSMLFLFYIFNSNNKKRYHMPALLINFENIFEINSSIYAYNSLYGLFMLKNDSFIDCNSKLKSTYYSKIYCFDDLIYAVSNESIDIYNDEFEWFKTIKIDGLSNDSIIYENDKLYFWVDSIVSRKLCYYDIIEECFYEDDTYPSNMICNIDGTSYFINNCYEFCEIDEKTQLNSHEYLKTFYVDGNIYTFFVDNDMLSISRDDKTCSKLCDDNMVLYDKIFFEDNKIFFALHQDNSKCITDDYCICHYSRSIIYSYNILTNEILIIKDINDHSFLFQYNSNTSFYSGGYLIDDFRRIEVDEIEVGRNVVPSNSTLNDVNMKSIIFVCYYNNLFYYYRFK